MSTLSPQPSFATNPAGGVDRSPTSPWVVTGVIVRRELILFVRQPARVAAAIGTPCLLWLFMGSGFAQSFRPPEQLGDASYASYLLPGMMTLVAVFAAIFSSISIIQDRRDGWLQSVLVSPAPRWSIALGKTLGGAIVAWAQAALLLAAAPLLDIHLTFWAAILALLGVAATSIAMTAVGVAFAWRTETTAAFHAVMNLVFMPAWLLSGALFPPQGASAWLGLVVRLNPLSWCTQAIRGPLLGEPSFTALAGSFIFAGAALACATWIVSAPTKRST